jgi:DNA-binding GntR family transcriptional regulator
MISRDDPRPAYQQLADLLRERIASGNITGRLPSERELQQTYGTAPMTSRKAIRLLADEGLVTTVAGRGSFVVRKD